MVEQACVDASASGLIAIALLRWGWSRSASLASFTDFAWQHLTHNSFPFQNTVLARCSRRNHVQSWA